MKQTLFSNVLASALALALGTAFAQTTAGTETTTTTAVSAGTETTTTTAVSTGTPASSSTVTGKLVSTFSDFAGSTENAAALVNGLRTGNAITLTSPAGTGSNTGATSAVTFTPPTKPMGYGNVRIALALAQAQLAAQGITQPTPTQLEAALMGGTLVNGTGTAAQTTQLQGVLQMRADGMGWGQIANSLGYKLGSVMSGLKSGTMPAPAATTATGITSAAGQTSAASGHGKAKGIVTASGATAGSAGSPGKGPKIVTAAGGTTPGGGVSTGLGHGHGAAAASGVTTAGGHGHGAANGHAKGGGKQ
ncbi:MAG: hypothetical protein ACOZCP_18880 [Pseudomonadota bacterium]